MEEKKLDSLEPGSKVQVIEILGKGPVRRRLLDMGLVPGTDVEVVRKAPFGDPIEYRVRGYGLSLRKAEAALVCVRTLED
ncbi:MAG: FeoA family protein [Methanosarcinaceae archaeon]|nr:FeoA family protein [Methanosarcinaceae archaeon]MDD4749752.1 FeoA family protein [Methanosarcinaceae archaeon]